MSRQGLWPPLRLADLAPIHWAVVAGHPTPFLTAVLISTVSLLFNAAGVGAGVLVAIGLSLPHSSRTPVVTPVQTGVMLPTAAAIYERASSKALAS